MSVGRLGMLCCERCPSHDLSDLRGNVSLYRPYTVQHENGAWNILNTQTRFSTFRSCMGFNGFREFRQTMDCSLLLDFCEKLIPSLYKNVLILHLACLNNTARNNLVLSLSLLKVCTQFKQGRTTRL